MFRRSREPEPQSRLRRARRFRRTSRRCGAEPDPVAEPTRADRVRRDRRKPSRSNRWQCHVRGVSAETSSEILPAHVPRTKRSRADVALYTPERKARAEQGLASMAAQIESGRLGIRDAIVAQEALVGLLIAELDARRRLCLSSVEIGLRNGRRARTRCAMRVYRKSWRSSASQAVLCLVACKRSSNEADKGASFGRFERSERSCGRTGARRDSPSCTPRARGRREREDRDGSRCKRIARCDAVFAGEIAPIRIARRRFRHPSRVASSK